LFAGIIGNSTMGYLLRWVVSFGPKGFHFV